MTDTNSLVMVILTGRLPKIISSPAPYVNVDIGHFFDVSAHFKKKYGIM